MRFPGAMGLSVRRTFNDCRFCRPRFKGYCIKSVTYLQNKNIGLLVAMECRVVPAKKYVLLKYRPMYSLEEYTTEFEKLARSQGENGPAPYFVEMLIYGKNRS